MSTYITIKDAAKILGVTKLTLRNWDKAGKLIANRHPINNYRIYKSEEIERIIEAMDSSPVEIARRKDLVKKLNVQHIEEGEQNIETTEISE